MKTSLEKTRASRRIKLASWWLAICLPIYVLSTGPVAWATNDGLHPAYLPEEVNVIYFPLASLMKVEWINQAFYYYTVVLWGGAPAGYTTV